MASPPETSQDSQSELGQSRSTKFPRSSSHDSELSGVAKVRKAGSSQVAGLTQMAITTADPVENQRLLSECLLNMNSENWSDIVNSFGKISQTTGRDPASEWRLALFRSGQVAGEQAMDQQLSGGLANKKHESWNILYGWGTKDPRAALEWIKKAEANGHQISPENFTAIIAGAALSDPENALKLIAYIPEQNRADCTGHLVWNVVQNGGTDALDHVLEYAASLRGSDPGKEVFANGLFHEATEKLLWKADKSLDVAQACDVVMKLTQVGADPTGTTRQAIEKYRWYAMPDKLNILETINASPHHGELDLSQLTSTVMRTMNGDGDQMAVREWMKEHPASPLIPYLRQKIPGE